MRIIGRFKARISKDKDCINVNGVRDSIRGPDFMDYAARITLT